MTALIERDAKVVWHPFTQHQTAGAPLPVASAQGSLLKLSDGTELIDAISSWWTSLFGHGNPTIVEAIQRQAATLDHVIYAGCTHEPAVTTAENSSNFSGFKNGKVFFPTMVLRRLVALKQTQYWQNVDEPQRTEFITFSTRTMVIQSERCRLATPVILDAPSRNCSSQRIEPIYLSSTTAPT